MSSVLVFRLSGRDGDGDWDWRLTTSD